VFESVNHVAPAVTAADHDNVDVTVTHVHMPDDPGFHVDSDTSNAESCETGTDANEAGLPTVVVNVTVPLRARPVLEEILSLTEALMTGTESAGVEGSREPKRPNPACGVIVTQSGIELTLHAVLEGTMKSSHPPAEVAVTVDSVAPDILATFTTGPTVFGV